MSENFFHYPDEVIFHANATNGVTFAEIRALTSDDDKLKALQKRLTDYYINGLKSIPHSFMMAIMTCVGIEVLGQLILGFKANGESIAEHTLNIYEMLDPKLAIRPSANFKRAYATNTNMSQNDMNSFRSYGAILRKGLRNAFTHNYRSLGVFIGGDELLTIDEDGGFLIIHHEMFRSRFINCFEEALDKVITNSHPSYRAQALRYFELLIR